MKLEIKNSTVKVVPVQVVHRLVRVSGKAEKTRKNGINHTEVVPDQEKKCHVEMINHHQKTDTIDGVGGVDQIHDQIDDKAVRIHGQIDGKAVRIHDQKDGKVEVKIGQQIGKEAAAEAETVEPAKIHSKRTQQMEHKMLNAGQMISILKMIDVEIHHTDDVMVMKTMTNSNDAMTEWEMNRADDTVLAMINKQNDNLNKISWTPDEQSVK